MFNKKNKNKRKLETSKVILITLFVFAAIIIGYTFIACIIVRDLSPLVALITAFFTAFLAGISFYFWKAKSENIIKYANKLEKLNKAKDVVTETNEAINEIKNIGEEEDNQ